MEDGGEEPPTRGVAVVSPVILIAIVAIEAKQVRLDVSYGPIECRRERMVVMMMVHGKLRAVVMAMMSATMMAGTEVSTTVVASTVVSRMAVFLGQRWAANEDYQSESEQA